MEFRFGIRYYLANPYLKVIMQEENLCILIDFENIAAGVERENLGRLNMKLIMNRLKEKGRILLSRAYGDWGRFAKFKQSLLEQGINMMELTSYRGQEKNRADIALVVDAMELAFTRPHIHTFVLLSGDSDFTPLVMKLRELDKKIIGMGTRKATSRLLAQSCDEFIFYDNLLKLANEEDHGIEDSTSQTPETLSKIDAFALLVESIKAIHRNDSNPIPAGMLKQFILRKTPTFDETDYGYSGFTDFLKEASQKQLLQLSQNAKGGGYLVTGAEEVAIEEHRREIALQNECAQIWLDTLTKNGIHPTSHLLRHTIVHEFVDHIMERRARKKRCTLLFTYGDISRRCRKTDPVASTAQVQVVLDALQKMGELFGNDNQPIRSKKANFIIHKDAEELLQSLRIYYLQQLKKCNIEVSDLQAISELLWGDLEHLKESQELIDQVETFTFNEGVSKSVQDENIAINTDENQDAQTSSKNVKEPNESSVKTTAKNNRKNKKGHNPITEKESTEKESTVDVTEDTLLQPASKSPTTQNDTLDQGDILGTKMTDSIIEAPIPTNLENNPQSETKNNKTAKSKRSVTKSKESQKRNIQSENPPSKSTKIKDSQSIKTTTVSIPSSDAQSPLMKSGEVDRKEDVAPPKVSTPEVSKTQSAIQKKSPVKKSPVKNSTGKKSTSTKSTSTKSTDKTSPEQTGPTKQKTAKTNNSESPSLQSDKIEPQSQDLSSSNPEPTKQK